MGLKTKIPWCDHSWNPWYGCRKVSAGCLHCYAQHGMKRYGRDFNTVQRAKDATFNAPLKWKEPATVFLNSWSDFFICDADTWRPTVWEIIKKTPHLHYKILTKRPANIKERLPADWDYGLGYPNMSLGVTIESNQFINRVDYLNGIALFKTCFVSIEPMIGEIKNYNKLVGIGQVIVGCESGEPHRDTKIEWVRNVRNFCIRNNIKFFLKQLRNEKGELIEMPELDGKIWNQR